MADTATKQRTLTPEHKQALAQGRKQGKVVRAYLAAVEDNRPRRGRKVTKEQLQKRLDETVQRLESEQLDPVTRLKLVQERRNLEDRLVQSDHQDISELEVEFIRSAKPWAESQGVSYAAFREIGVPASVLKSAGLAKAS